ncbi:MAG: hypothetical protein CMD08_01300, partial [Flavobacteriales bacterium]|nr:hypothetical protein [Flavobacteriales bacterium]
MKILTISKLFFLLTGFLFALFAIRIIGVEVYGETTFIIGLLYVFDFIFSGKNEINILKSKSKLLSSDLIKSLLKGSSIFFLVLFILSIFLSKVFSDYIFFYPIISWLSGMQAVFQMHINKNYKLKFLAYNNLFIGIFNLSIGLLLIYFFKEIGYFISISLSLLLSVLYYLSKFNLNFKDILISKPLYFWNNKASFIFSSFSITSFGDVLPIFVKFYFNSYILGIYMISVKIIKTGFSFIANLYANYLIKSNIKIKSLIKITYVSLFTYILILLTYNYIKEISYFIDLINMIIGVKDSQAFINYSIYFVSIFF